ncbi:MAG: hydroxyacylglutathione hydrolase [Alphaproteobacteria bacterium]
MTALTIVQFNARDDNFAVLIHDPNNGATAAIDAPETAPIQAELAKHGWKLTHILVTHKHLDHIKGIPELTAAGGVEVIGPEKSAAETGLYDRTVSEGDRFDFAGHEVAVLETPGHTLDHVSYYIADSQVVFAGDTLFALGCGRVFEGTPPMMWESLLKLRALPGDTALYCGHEYTLANARFAVTADPDNAALASRLIEIEALRAEDKPTLPSTIGREKETNPFLRADNPGPAKAMGLAGADPVTVFAEIRGRKDRF